jgi:hypothetical protein
MVPIGQEAVWDSELFWTQRLEEESSAFAGDRTLVVQSVVRHYTELPQLLNHHMLFSRIHYLLSTLMTSFSFGSRDCTFLVTSVLGTCSWPLVWAPLLQVLITVTL